MIVLFPPATWKLSRFHFHSMLEQGIYLPPSQFETNFLSLAHSPEDIQKTITAAEVAFAEVTKARGHKA